MAFRHVLARVNVASPRLRNAFQSPSFINRAVGMPKLSRLNGNHRIVRNYSSKPLLRLSRSPFTYPLASGLWAGVVGSLLFYWWHRRRGSEKLKLERSKRSQGKEVTSQFAGKTVLITGAAGDIGGATAEAFARKGATLVLVDLPQCADMLQKRCSQLEAQGAERVLFIPADVTKAEDVEKMAQFALQNTGGIDCFFNNAGVQGKLCPLHKQNDQDFDRVIRVNIYGVFLGMKYVSRVMIEKGKGGVIVNTSSVAGVLGPPNMAAYAASKFAVVGMTKTGAKDLAPFGIRVCAIAPGIIEGKLWGSQIKGRVECIKQLQGDESEVTEEETKRMEKRMIEGTPMKRLGKLSEVAAVVTYLCSEDASYVTGAVVTVDGGRYP